jgi:hypothetical protein
MQAYMNASIRNVCLTAMKEEIVITFRKMAVRWDETNAPCW